MNARETLELLKDTMKACIDVGMDANKILELNVEVHKALEKQMHEYTQVIRSIDDIIYDHVDTMNYKIIMRQIYEVFGLDWSEEEGMGDYDK